MTGNCKSVSTFCLHPPITKRAENDDDDNGYGSNDYDYNRDNDGNKSIQLNSIFIHLRANTTAQGQITKWA
jgi:hypothetical protein